MEKVLGLVVDVDVFYGVLLLNLFRYRDLSFKRLNLNLLGGDLIALKEEFLEVIGAGEKNEVLVLIEWLFVYSLFIHFL
jgi:hypothetical protein